MLFQSQMDKQAMASNQWMRFQYQFLVKDLWEYFWKSGALQVNISQHHKLQNLIEHFYLRKLSSYSIVQLFDLRIWQNNRSKKSKITWGLRSENCKYHQPKKLEGRFSAKSRMQMPEGNAESPSVVTETERLKKSQAFSPDQKLKNDCLRIN